MLGKLASILFLVACASRAQTGSLTHSNATGAAAPLLAPAPTQTLNADQRAEQIRATCVEGRRFIAGRVVQITREGLVVDSGYRQLLTPPFNHSWLVPGTAAVDAPAPTIEQKSADALCVGLVFLTNIPKRPQVKCYDYLVLHGYPAGSYAYVPVAGVNKTIRRFSASLERAVEMNMASEKKTSAQ